MCSMRTLTTAATKSGRITACVNFSERLWCFETCYMRHIPQDRARSSILNECVSHLCRWCLPEIPPNEIYHWQCLALSCTDFFFYHGDNSFAGINPWSEFGEIQPLCSNFESNAEFHLVIAWSFLWTVPVFDPEPAQVTVRVVSQKFGFCL